MHKVNLNFIKENKNILESKLNLMDSILKENKALLFSKPILDREKKNETEQINQMSKFR